MDFDEAFERLIGHEGGYVNDPRDPGGETQYGISKRSYPAEDIRSLTLERAKAIYRRDFWNAVRGEELPAVLKFAMFDAAVNSGPKQAIKWLQQSVRVEVDGLFGPKTMVGVRIVNPDRTAARIAGYRLMFMTELGAWTSYGRGWARRIAANLIAG